MKTPKQHIEQIKALENLLIESSFALDIKWKKNAVTVLFPYDICGLGGIRHHLECGKTKALESIINRLHKLLIDSREPFYKTYLIDELAKIGEI